MRHFRDHSGRQLLCLLALIAASVVLGACGGSNDDGGTTASPTSRSTQGTAAAASDIEQMRKVPSFEAPGPAFDAAAAAGKTVMVIPANSSVPYLETIVDRMKAVGEEAGLDVVDWPNQGSPPQWVQGIESAINRNVASIELLGGIDPAVLRPQLAAARKAGIPVIVSALYDPDEAVPADTTATVPLPYRQGGSVMGNWVVADSDGEANVLVVSIKEVLASAPLIDGIRSALDENCSACEMSLLNATIQNFSTQIQPQVQSALLRDPNIDYIVPLYDSAMAPFVQAAVRAAGAQNRVKVVTFNGTPSVLKDLQNGAGIAMDVGTSLDWIAHGIVDQHLRVIAGEPPVKDSRIPLRVFDETNVDDTGTPPVVNEGYGDEYVAGYRQLWGLEK